MNKGLIFSVKRYSVHDGPGIRVTFFMKGCPLHCLWCHNPEGISPLPEMVERINKVGEREFKREEEVGRYYTADELLGMLKQESVFISNSKGGVTFSGGEPLLQPEFLLEALKACKANGYHTAVDTSGYSTVTSYESVIPYTDLFLFDIKHLDNNRHLELTGVPNIGILDVYRMLTESGKDLFLRIPVIPGFNDDEEYLLRLKQFIIATRTDSIRKINLLPFHKIGASKYKRFKLPYLMDGIEPPTTEAMNRIKLMFQETGIKVKIGG